MKLSPLAPTAPTAPVRQDQVAETGAALPMAAAVVAPEVQLGVQALTVQRAQAELAQMPEVDGARVAEIKDALARGDIAFDPQKLAQLVVRHHGGQA